jgi:hypothetical protein
MKKFNSKIAFMMLAIAFFMIDKSLHLHHSEEIKDQITLRYEKIFQTYYGEAIGGNIIL